MAEIKSLKRILDKIKIIRCTCFIDEILRGTNTVERIGASSAVLKYLSNMDCLCMVASHDIELTEIMGGVFDNYHFCEKVNIEGVKFDYKIKKGPSTTKNAIKLLSTLGFDEKLVEDANKLVEGYSELKTWERF